MGRGGFVDQFHFHHAARQQLNTSPKVVSSMSNQSGARRIDTTQPAERWRYQCPECGSTNWRCHNSTIGCRACHSTVECLVDAATGEQVPREDLTFVGPHANHKSRESYPPGRGGYR